jgi:tRNA threonylcarbamoyladenosine modification (KEOPS) complex  Pcc1 subunit
MITSTITFPRSAELLTLLKAEQESFAHPRTSYTASEQGNSITVDITADDATALKTVVSSVCRIVAVYEKARKV